MTQRQNAGIRKELFNRIADTFGFEPFSERCNARLRYAELSVVYDRLYILGYIDVSREDKDTVRELREKIGDAVNSDREGGKYLYQDDYQTIVDILDDVDMRGEFEDSMFDYEDREFPTTRDLVRVANEDMVQEWHEPENCVCVSRHGNHTRYHSSWTLKHNSNLVPVCRGYNPSQSDSHRLVPEKSIKRTYDECKFCANGELRL